MLTEEQILALRPKIDVVFTNIPPEGEIFSNSRWRTVKFASLITQAKLLWIKENATLVFYRMVDLGFYCPNVTQYTHNKDEYCIRFRWKEDTRIITIELHKDGRHTVTLGLGVESTSISGYEPIESFVDALSELKDDSEPTNKEFDPRQEHLD